MRVRTFSILCRHSTRNRDTLLLHLENTLPSRSLIGAWGSRNERSSSVISLLLSSFFSSISFSLSSNSFCASSRSSSAHSSTALARSSDLAKILFMTSFRARSATVGTVGIRPVARPTRPLTASLRRSGLVLRKMRSLRASMTMVALFSAALPAALRLALSAMVLALPVSRLLMSPTPAMLEMAAAVTLGSSPSVLAVTPTASLAAFLLMYSWGRLSCFLSFGLAVATLQMWAMLRVRASTAVSYLSALPSAPLSRSDTYAS
mmetsp:Transcript_13548/g.26911  ORF Transcript_13548/g.26911 Transcript_13548/m.26911 type:complete len:262 (+) Transcript_13548:996-1781(+)